MPSHVAADLRAARANRVFDTDERHIRIKNTVMDKSNIGLGLLLYKIDGPRGRFFVRATSQLCNLCNHGAQSDSLPF